MAAPFRQWPQFCVASALTFSVGMLLYAVVEIAAPRLATDNIILFCEVLFASLVFDAYWTSALTDANLTKMVCLPSHKLFWKFLALSCLLDFAAIIMFLIAFHLNGDKLSIEDFAPVRLLLARVFGSIWLWNNFLVTALTTVAVIGRVRLMLWPSFLALTGRCGNLTAAWQLGRGIVRDLALVNVAMSLPILIIGMFALALAPAGLTAFIIILAFVCIQRAFVIPLYLECIAGKFEHGEAMRQPLGAGGK